VRLWLFSATAPPFGAYNHNYKRTRIQLARIGQGSGGLYFGLYSFMLFNVAQCWLSGSSIIHTDFLDLGGCGSASCATCSEERSRSSCVTQSMIS